MSEHLPPEDDAFRTQAVPDVHTPPPPAGTEAVSLLLGDHVARQGADSGADSARPSTAGSGAVARVHLFRSLSGASAGSVPAARVPTPGDRVFGFRLVRELGRGSFARVFLAEQTDLAGRPVVLKVSAAEGSEHRALAQLQHTNIVPIFSAHEDPRADVRALCMPYFGGAALSDVLRNAFDANPHPTRGAELIEALDRVAPPTPGAAFDQSPRAALSGMGYVSACAWLVARLAEGLHHAHQRGILHRDVKPSNVLLAGDGQPMHLDFNLAQDDGADGGRVRLGGTVAYMAPEHLRAMAKRDPALAKTVDHRADVYSLGMVLYEMLAGRSPTAASASTGPLPVVIQALAVERGRAAPSLRAARPDAPWGLESIVRKCLAPSLADRYQTADELAEDLRRQLSDRPLRHAPELSTRERVRKWSRRHPRLSAVAAAVSVAAALLVGTGLALSATRDRLADTEDRLAAARSEERVRAYRDGTVRALFLVNTTADLRDHLRQGLGVCEETLTLYRVLGDPAWQDRPDWQRLSPDERRELAADTQDLLLLLAGAKVRLAPDDPAARAAALALLDRAEAIPDLPPCRALWEDRATYLTDGAAARARAAEIAPATARDHYLLGMTAARGGRYDAAVRHLDEAVRLNPRHYWSWLQRGLCHLSRGEPALAVGDFGACVGLRPDFAWGFFNRGCAVAECGKPAEAVEDYAAALRRDPDLVPAYFNRGLLALELGRDADALADFQAAAVRGRDDAAVHSGRGVALERLGRHPEADAAFRLASARTAGLTLDARHRLAWAHGFAVLRRDPAAARAAFAAVLREDADNPQALYGSGTLTERDGRDAEALGLYTRAVDAAPGLVPARRARAVVLARLGRLREAGQEVNVCLDREPRSGATVYAAACVAALAAEHGDPTARRAAADQAVDLLRRAFDLGYGRETAATDRDLNGVRDDARFRGLLRAEGP